MAKAEGETDGKGNSTPILNRRFDGWPSVRCQPVCLRKRRDGHQTLTENSLHEQVDGCLPYSVTKDDVGAVLSTAAAIYMCISPSGVACYRRSSFVTLLDAVPKAVMDGWIPDQQKRRPGNKPGQLEMRDRQRSQNARCSQAAAAAGRLWPPTCLQHMPRTGRKGCAPTMMSPAGGLSSWWVPGLSGPPPSKMRVGSTH